MSNLKKMLALSAPILMLVWPFITGDYLTGLMTQILIFGLLALSADLLLGYAGLFSLCHASFFSVAAYTAAILQVRYQVPVEVSAICGVLSGTLLGLIFGLSVRTRGVYFILVTLAMGYVVWGIGYRWASFTGGDSGVTGVAAFSLFGFSFSSPKSYYFVVLFVVSALIAVYAHLTASPFGLALRGIKSSEPRMRSLGFHPVAHLYVAFVISSAMASIAGVLYVYFNKFVNPVSASLHVSVDSVLMAIVGGSGSLFGPFIGSAIVLWLRNWVSTFIELHLAVMGLVFIAVVLWAPSGVMGWVHEATSKSSREKS
jgi:branched-chain amino acid transport system permease protein